MVFVDDICRLFSNSYMAQKDGICMLVFLWLINLTYGICILFLSGYMNKPLAFVGGFPLVK